MKRFSIILVSVLAACAAEAPPDGGGGGTNNTGGGGDDTGSGGGSGSGSGGSGGGGNNGSINATSFLSQIATKICDQAFSCQTTFPTDWGATFAEIFGASASACVSDAATSDEPAKVEQSITAGKIKFNGADAATCVAGITVGTCSTFWNDGPTFPAACATAMVGTVADGAACSTHIECVNPESYCAAAKCTAGEAGARIVGGRQLWHLETLDILKSGS